MDFLEELFDLGRHKHRRSDGAFHEEDHHDHDRRHPYPTNAYPQVPANHALVASNPATFPSGVVCRRCSSQTIQGATFCHGCGTAIEMILNCASCGSKLTANAPSAHNADIEMDKATNDQ
jgi:hypothetical protein